jgi:hypothetical protein
MKKVLVPLILVTFICITPAYACTSFAVYSEQPLYAMNFDYSPTEKDFALLKTGKRIYQSLLWSLSKHNLYEKKITGCIESK